MPYTTHKGHVPNARPFRRKEQEIVEQAEVIRRLRAEIEDLKKRVRRVEPPVDPPVPPR